MPTTITPSIRSQPSRSHHHRGPAVIACGHRLRVARVAGTLQPNRSSAAAAFALVAADLEAGLETLWAELQRHVAGQLHDDVALLLIEHSR
jgi:hypothetical protein